MFPRLTALATTTAAAAVAFTGTALPANAEAVVYDSYGVQSNPPDGSAHEYANLDIPTGYEVDRLNWHTTVFHETIDQGRAIHVDLHPKSDTVDELRAERAALMEEYGDGYKEFAFDVKGNDVKVQARWSFTFTEPGTGDVDPFVSVMLMNGNQIRIAGKLAEREQIRNIRQHVRESVVFPG